jgi:hypothetical protein
MGHPHCLQAMSSRPPPLAPGKRFVSQGDYPRSLMISFDIAERLLPPYRGQFLPKSSA